MTTNCFGNDDGNDNDNDKDSDESEDEAPSSLPLPLPLPLLLLFLIIPLLLLLLPCRLPIPLLLLCPSSKPLSWPHTKPTKGGAIIQIRLECGARIERSPLVVNHYINPSHIAVKYAKDRKG